MAPLRSNLAGAHFPPSGILAAILGCGLWLLFVHVYEPWRYYHRGYKPGSLFQGAGFFFWRIGFNISPNRPVAVAVGLASIALLMYVSGWVVRGFLGVQPSADPDVQPSRITTPRASGQRLAKIAKLALGVMFVGVLLGTWFLGTTLSLPTFVHEAVKYWSVPVQPAPALTATTEQPAASPDIFDKLADTPPATPAQPAQPPSTFPPPGFQLPDSQTQTGNALAKLLADTPVSKSPIVSVVPHPVIPTSPPTGAWILRPRGTRGYGLLRIQNGTDFDSAVKLVTVAVPRKTVWAVFVRAHDEKTVNGIAHGDYLLRFSFGRDWDRRTRKFLSDASFYQAGKQLDFTETEPDAHGPGEYTKFDVTLHDVPNGNLSRTPISEAVFNEGESGNSEQTAHVAVPVTQ